MTGMLYRLRTDAAAVLGAAPQRHACLSVWRVLPSSCVEDALRSLGPSRAHSATAADGKAVQSPIAVSSAFVVATRTLTRCWTDSCEVVCRANAGGGRTASLVVLRWSGTSFGYTQLLWVYLP